MFKESSGILATLNDINLSNISSTNKLSNNVYFRGIHTGRLFLFSLKLTWSIIIDVMAHKTFSKTADEGCFWKSREKRAPQILPVCNKKSTHLLIWKTKVLMLIKLWALVPFTSLKILLLHIILIIFLRHTSGWPNIYQVHYIIFNNQCCVLF